MWQKSIIFGAIIAAVVFLIGFVQNLATIRMLVIRSLLTATGSILAVVVAQKAIRNFTSSRESVEAPLNNLNLGEFIEEDEASTPESGEQESAPAPGTTESSAQEDLDVDNDDLQDALEEEVEKGNEEGVEEIADLISDSMDEE